MVLPSFHHGTRQPPASCFPLMSSTIHCWSNGLSLLPLATTSVIFHSLYFCVLLLCQPFQVRCLRLQNLKCCLHKENLPHPKPPNLPPLSPALAFTLRGCSQPSDAPTQRSSARWEETTHRRAAITKRVTRTGRTPALVKRRSFWNWSLNVKNRMVDTGNGQ